MDIRFFLVGEAIRLRRTTAISMLCVFAYQRYFLECLGKLVVITGRVSELTISSVFVGEIRSTAGGSQREIDHVRIASVLSIIAAINLANSSLSSIGKT